MAVAFAVFIGSLFTTVTYRGLPPCFTLSPRASTPRCLGQPLAAVTDEVQQVSFAAPVIAVIILEVVLLLFARSFGRRRRWTEPLVGMALGCAFGVAISTRFSPVMLIDPVKLVLFVLACVLLPTLLTALVGHRLWLKGRALGEYPSH